MLTPEQEEIENILKRLVASREAARRAAEGGAAVDAALWCNLSELGFLGIALPAEAGGVGLGLAEEAIVTEVLGGVVAPIPTLPVYVAAHILAAGGLPAAAEVARTLASGEKVVGAALSAGSEIAEVALTLGKAGDTGRLTGVVEDLFDGSGIEIALVAAEGGWWAVHLSGEGVIRTEIASLIRPDDWPGPNFRALPRTSFRISRQARSCRLCTHCLLPKRWALLRLRST